MAFLGNYHLVLQALAHKKKADDLQRLADGGQVLPPHNLNNAQTAQTAQAAQPQTSQPAAPTQSNLTSPGVAFNGGNAPNSVNAENTSGLGGFITAAHSTPTHYVGNAMQDIGSAFTAQNQYQAQQAQQDQNNYQGTIGQASGQALSGYDQFLQNQGQQQGVANQLANTGQQYQGIANGSGPNPAQNALNQATGQNVANQAALMASSRGASANSGAIARQAAMQGGALQQNSAGQAATLQSQQQLAGLAGLQANQQAQGAVYGQMGSGITTEQGANNSLFNAATGAQNTQNANNITNLGMQQGINSQVAQNNTNAVNKNMSGIMGGLSALIAKGGKVSDAPKVMLADGGDVSNGFPTGSKEGGGDPMSKLTSGFGGGSAPMGVINTQYAPHIGGEVQAPQAAQKPAPKHANFQDYLNKATKDGFKPTAGNTMTGPDADTGVPPDAMPAQDMFTAAQGGLVPAMLSPGEKYLNPSQAATLKENPKAFTKLGKIVPGKPKHKGNNYANDVVPAKLEAGGVVIPNSIMQSKDPMHGAVAFVRAHLSKNKGLKRK